MRSRFQLFLRTALALGLVLAALLWAGHQTTHGSDAGITGDTPSCQWCWAGHNLGHSLANLPATALVLLLLLLSFTSVNTSAKVLASPYLWAAPRSPPKPSTTFFLSF